MNPRMRRLALLGVLIGSHAYAAPAKARLSLGTPNVKAGLDEKAVVTVVQRTGAKLLACYTAALAKTPELQGTATATFTVGGNGNVIEAAVKGLNHDAHKCISGVLMKLEFAKPKDGKSVGVAYPMTFSPVDRPQP
jgi:hypothetical protein